MSASWGFQIGGFAARVARSAKLRALAAGLSVVILAGLLPIPTQAQQRTAAEQSLAPYLPGEEFSGLIAGGLFGALNGSNEITNQQQLTGCPPFCMPGFTPNSTATSTAAASTVARRLDTMWRCLMLSFQTLP
jgi:hypothetical protein